MLVIWPAVSAWRGFLLQPLQSLTTWTQSLCPASLICLQILFRPAVHPLKSVCRLLSARLCVRNCPLAVVILPSSVNKDKSRTAGMWSRGATQTKRSAATFQFGLFDERSVPLLLLAKCTRCCSETLFFSRNHFFGVKESENEGIKWWEEMYRAETSQGNKVTEIFTFSFIQLSVSARWITVCVFRTNSLINDQLINLTWSQTIPDIRAHLFALSLCRPEPSDATSAAAARICPAALPTF